MTDYRRNQVPGGTYFFTVNLYHRRSELLTRNIEILRRAVRKVRARAPFHIDAWVALPDHLHSLWTLPEGDTDCSARWQAIKTAFSKQIPEGEFRSASRLGKGERGIWQRRFWEHTIRDEDDYGAHVDYIHFNPVKHGLVAQAADWPYSSFHRSVAMGLYPAAWAGSGARALNGVGRHGTVKHETPKAMGSASLTDPTLAAEKYGGGSTRLIISNFNTLESAALDRIADEYPNHKTDLIKAFGSCFVVKRENTGKGFYTDLEVHGQIKLPDQIRGTFGDAWLRVDGMKVGICCLLHFKKGVPATLEGYAAAGEDTSGIDFNKVGFEVENGPPT